MQGLGREMDSSRFANIREEGLDSLRACLPIEIANPYGEPSGRFRGNVCRCFRFFLALSIGSLRSVREDGFIASWTHTSGVGLLFFVFKLGSCPFGHELGGYNVRVGP